jgi:hypothetical protein
LFVCVFVRRSDSNLSSLVSEWLNMLLTTLRNPNTDSWIRRSRGLAFAFLSILQSEPMRNSSKLLSHTMIQLMEMSKDSTDWKIKVNGLNIMRAIFRDSSLHIDALQFIAEAMEVSIQGFAHPK